MHVLGLALMLAAAPVGTGWAETIELTVGGDDAALTKALRAASPLLAAERDGTTDPLDLFAAARSEYAGLLAALYARGHFSAVISVKIDGREAADIPPLDAPGAVGAITVTVDPGPVFVFSRADVGPLAPGTVLPTAYAAGQVAETGAIRDAASVAVTGWRSVGNAKAAVGGQDLTVNHADARLSADIRMDPGPKLRFGRFAIAGRACSAA
jgi:translocation and assembly module TamA